MSNNIFGLHGVGGLLIAVALLLTIIGYSAVNAVITQNDTATKPYTITGSKVANPTTKQDIYANLSEVKMFDQGADSRIKILGQ